jgi:Ser/Thr protein kinase RdoA (MazF antagonist)
MNHSRLIRWWTDDPLDPGRLTMNDQDVRNLVKQISPDSTVTDLGGTMSLNVKIEPDNFVLRIHQPFMTRQRLLAVQDVRIRCTEQGLIVPLPVYGMPLLRCRNRWVELEKYIPHERLKPTEDSYVWLFQAMGVLHSTLAKINVMVPRPLVATYATPSTLRRWNKVTETVVQGDTEVTEHIRALHDLVKMLSKQWVYSSEIPVHLIHGDVRLSNVCQNSDRNTIFFDFGFAAHRPRIHDIAYAISFMVLAQGGYESLNTYRWQNVGRLIKEYELAANTKLTSLERRALAPYTAAAPLYQVAIAGLSNDTAKQLRAKQHFLRLGEWILMHPEALSD